MCNRAVPKSLGYQVESEVRSGSFTGQTVQETIRGYICPECNFRMSYKTSQKKLDKFRGVLGGKWEEDNA